MAFLFGQRLSLFITLRHLMFHYILCERRWTDVKMKLCLFSQVLAGVKVPQKNGNLVLQRYQAPSHLDATTKVLRCPKRLNILDDPLDLLAHFAYCSVVHLLIFFSAQPLEHFLQLQSKHVDFVSVYKVLRRFTRSTVCGATLSLLSLY